jgi:DNA-binding transcriptional LysR family regulator
VDPHLLRTFVAVAECGSFSAAAAQLGYTQSAVSQHIAALEADLGTPLLRRRPVVPTPSGQRLLEHAGPILLRLDAARADVRRTVAGPPGTLTIAASSLAAGSSAEAMAEVRRTHITLTVLGRGEVVEAVAAGTYALGLTDGVAAPTDPLHLAEATHLRTVAVAHEDLMVALPRAHPLAGRSGLTLANLVDARWIDAPDLAAPLATLRAAAGSDAVRPAFTYHGTDLRTLLELIAAGHGLAVLPRSAITSQVAAVPLTSPRLVHRTELVHSRQPSEAAEAVIAALSGRP